MLRLIAGLALLLSFVVAPAYAAQDTIARAAIVIDATTGAVLLDKNSDQRIPTASMSKVMTILAVFDALKNGQIRLDDTFTVSEKAWRMQGSKMFVELGSSIPVEDLIKGVIVQSGNDATIVLAEGIAGSEEKFANLLNEMAARYGMTGSRFMNASGWPDPNHYSTPRDLAVMAWHLVRDYPQEYKYYSMREFTWHGITQQNRNPILGKVEGADGIKTGHTEEAGYGLIGSAERGGRRVIMVVSGLPSMADREAESIRLMNWALDSFRIARLMTAGQVVMNAPVVYGKSKTVGMALGKDVISTIPATLRNKDLTLKAKFMSPLVAPIAAGQQVGTLEITIPDMGVQSYPLVAAAAVDKKGFVGLTFDKIIQAAKNK